MPGKILGLILTLTILGCNTSPDLSPRREAMLRMRQLIGILHDNFDGRSFPPAVWMNDKGDPTCSWRLLIIDQTIAPDSSPNIDESWQSAENQQFDTEVKIVRALFTVESSNPPSEFADIFAIVGPGTAFTEFGRHKGKDTHDCPGDAILLVDHTNDSIHWMQPGDIEIDELMKPDWTNGIGRLAPNYPEGFLVGFVDGSVWCISKDVPRDVICKFLTVESASNHDRTKELGPYTIEKVPPLSKGKDGRYGFEPIDRNM